MVDNRTRKASVINRMTRQQSGPNSTTFATMAHRNEPASNDRLLDPDPSKKLGARTLISDSIPTSGKQCSMPMKSSSLSSVERLMQNRSPLDDINTNPPDTTNDHESHRLDGRAELLASTPSLEEIERDSSDESGCDPTDNGFTDAQLRKYEILRKKLGRATRRIDRYRIHPKDHEKDPVKIDYIKNVDWTKQRQQRAGVIVYREIDGRLIFCMGADTSSDNITDFGGGVKQRDRNSVRGGLREFLEETLGVFGSFTEDQVQNCLVVYSEVMMIMFLHLDFNIETTTALFEDRLRRARHPEIKKLVWMSKARFFSSIDERNEPNAISPFSPDRERSSTYPTSAFDESVSHVSNNVGMDDFITIPNYYGTTGLRAGDLRDVPQHSIQRNSALLAMNGMDPRSSQRIWGLHHASIYSRQEVSTLSLREAPDWDDHRSLVDYRLGTRSEPSHSTSLPAEGNIQKYEDFWAMYPEPGMGSRPFNVSHGQDTSDIDTKGNAEDSREMYSRVQTLLDSAVTCYGDFTHRL